MNTVKDALEALDSVGIPFTQISWSGAKPPNLPYAVLSPGSTANTFKDNAVQVVPVRYSVELFTRERDIPLEKRLQEAFDAKGIRWQRNHAVEPDGYVVVAMYSMTLFE